MLSYGQISPGDLSSAHADLEGISNCTLCHDIGEKVSNKKCLDCHDNIRSLINADRGYHANNTIKSKDCFDCHSDHHGRKFDMVRFDEKAFDHDKTGYNLEGKHEVIDCRKCHVSDNIENKEFKKRKDTFLGLDQKCLSCHDDFHQNTLSTNDCSSCHDLEAFKPAPKFDHDEADYILKDKHKEVACAECHVQEERNGKEFQNFSEVEFGDCKSCHEDPHNANLSGKCTQCHNEVSFSNFIGEGRFDHNSSEFELKGKHLKVDCFTCHKEESNSLLVFQDKLNIEENNCAECHADEHEGKYNFQCAECHNESSFLVLNNMDFFDHNVADFHLEGKHIGIDCKACHKSGFSAAIPFETCVSCHSDYHRGEFTKEGITPDCIECHSLEEGFDYSLYTIEQHQSSAFVLSGAHLATPCFACHVNEKEERWSFVDLGSECNDCHTDVHERTINEALFPDQNYNCTFCHVNDTWQMISFDHTNTSWQLEGAHKSVECKSCHFPDNENINRDFTFKEIGLECFSCHENIHEDLFAIDGITDCKRCHQPEDWFPYKFDHNSTAFALDGKHAEIECKACHLTTNESGVQEVIYKLGKFECIDCH